jgi:hypothetical protein
MKRRDLLKNAGVGVAAGFGLTGTASAARGSAPSRRSLDHESLRSLAAEGAVKRTARDGTPVEVLDPDALDDVSRDEHLRIDVAEVDGLESLSAADCGPCETEVCDSYCVAWVWTGERWVCDDWATDCDCYEQDGCDGPR